nr:hypothetical protein [Bacteroidota bacterium]
MYALDYDSAQYQPFETRVSSYALDSSSKYLSILFEDNRIVSTDNEGNVFWVNQIQGVDSEMVFGGDDTLFYHYFTNYGLKLLRFGMINPQV